MKKLLIFDFDGVLEDTFELSYDLFKVQLPNLKRTEYKSWFDGNLYIQLKKKDIKINMSTYYLEYTKALLTLKIKPEWQIIFEQLSHEFSFAIISSSPGGAIEQYLLNNNIDRYFDYVWGYEKHSSKVEKIQLLLKNYSGSRKDCWFITDTLGDLFEGAKVQIPCVAVSWGFHSREQLERASPEAVVNTPEELLEFIVSKKTHES